MPEVHQKCVVLIEHGNIRLKTLHEEISNLLVKDLFRHEPVSEEDSLCVGVYNKGRLVPSIKENAISGLWSDAIDG